MNASSNDKKLFSFDAGSETTGWINFNMPDGRHIVLDAKLNNIPSEIVLDSGVGSIVISRPMATKLGLEIRESFTGVGVTGSAQGAVAEGIAISIGNLTIQAPKTTIIDLSALSAVTGRTITAVIGRDLLADLIADIDFPGKRLAFRSSGVSGEVVNATELPLIPGGLGLREIPISVEGRAPIQAVFDLGSDTPLYLSNSYVAQQSLFSGKRTSTSLSAGIEGTEVNTVAVVAMLKIGETTLHDIPIEVPQNWSQPAVGFVGLPILSRFRLIIDFKRNRLGIVPNSEAVGEPFRKDRSGIGAMPSNDSLKIIHVAAHSPAEIAGLHVGDEIVEINGRKIDAEYFKSRSREGSKPAGTIFHLKLKSGSDLTFTLADYF